MGPASHWDGGASDSGAPSVLASASGPPPPSSGPPPKPPEVAPADGSAVRLPHAQRAAQSSGIQERPCMRVIVGLGCAQVNVRFRILVRRRLAVRPRPRPRQRPRPRPRHDPRRPALGPKLVTPMWVSLLVEPFLLDIPRL